MHILSGFFVWLGYLLTLSQTQSYKSSFSRWEPLSASYYDRASRPLYSNSHSQNLAQRNAYPYSTSKRIYGSYKIPSIENTATATYAKTKWNYENTPSKTYFPNSMYRTSSSGFNQPYNSPNKQYLSNALSIGNYKKNSSSKSKAINNNRVSKADAENSKFAGAENQENEDSGRTAFLKRKKFHRRFGGVLGNPCSPYARDTGNGITPSPKGEGRFLWGFNVYNIYPQTPVGLGCGGYGGFGGGLGAGLLSDPIAPAYNSPGAGISNFLSLFAPGILQNSLAVTGRPQQFADYVQSPPNNNLQVDPEVDPNYVPGPASVPVRRPNRVSYDSAGASPITPGQLVGGISTTVNGIIQQLTGNVQPVYG